MAARQNRGDNYIDGLLPDANPQWLAFFREARRLAALARQREAAQATSAATVNPQTTKAPVDAGDFADPSTCERTELEQQNYTRNHRRGEPA